MTALQFPLKSSDWQLRMGVGAAFAAVYYATLYLAVHLV